MHEERTPGRAALTLLLVLATAVTAGVAVAGAVQPAATPQEATPDRPGTEPDPEAMELGGEVYRSQCLSCHGSQGKGDGPASRFVDPKPRDLTASDWQYVESGTVDEIAELVAAGIDDTAMEPFRELLTEEEIRAVATYVVHEIVPEGSESQ